ncbi:MAG: type I restriction enzyme HsdR N-terminal domain-containing protein [Rikenellaceae bacterium]
MPPIKLRARHRNGVCEVWDELRRCYIVLTPEEWVRRHVVAMFVEQMQIPAAQIIVEYPVALNTQRQRADVVVVDRNAVPLLMVECKSYDVKLSQSTLDQAVRYNSVLCAKYIVLTNGLTHRCYQQSDCAGVYTPIDSLPVPLL